MPRDSNGDFDLTSGNPVASGDVIASSRANTTMPDIAQGLTDSLDRNGRGGMNAPLPFADGSEAAPGISWANETSSGCYRAGAADMRASLQGADFFRLQGGQAQVWADAQWNRLIYAGAEGALPDGTAPWQSVVWNNSSGAWELTTNIVMNDATGEITAAEFHGVADDALKVTGKAIAVVTALPGTPDPNTIYFVTGGP